MRYFLETVDTIKASVGFSHFDSLHITWLVAMVAVTLLNSLWYRKLSIAGREKWRKIVALLIVADEIFKDVMLFVGGRFTVGYLPFHLCSINIFVIAIHAWKPSKLLGGFLYTVCIPGALAAMLFPTWTKLPVLNFMHLHSFTVHILLAMYPIVLTSSGDIKPDIEQLAKSLGLLVLMAIPIYGINLLLDTNFMFLMSADPGNPLYLFEQMWGNHLLGFPVIIAGVLLVMYGPLLLVQKLRKKEL